MAKHRLSLWPLRNSMNALRFLVASSLIIGLLVTLLAFSTVWPGDMFAAFRLQLWLLSLVAMGLTLLLKARWLLGLAGVVLALNTVPVALRYFSRPVLPAQAVSGMPVSVLFSNVLFENRHYSRVLALVEREDAEIFVAVETSPQWLDALGALKARYPYSYTHSSEGVAGIAIYARTPFTAETIRGGGMGMVMIRAEFKDFVLYVGHPMPPISPRLGEAHRVYMQQMAYRVGKESKTVILAGDLNSTLWSDSMGLLMGKGMQWPNGSGTLRTWPVRNSPFGIQIDHVLTKGMVAGHFRVLEDVGSDHLPVRANLILPAPSATAVQQKLAKPSQQD